MMAIMLFKVIKVTNFGTNQQATYDCLLVNNGNLLLSCTISDIWLILVKFLLVTGSPFTLTPSLR